MNASPTDWNACYENHQTPWDRGVATPVLAEVHARHPGLFAGAVMVPGCGIGHDARWLAGLGSVEAVTGMDIAPIALDRAKALDPQHLVRFVHADLFDLPEDLQAQFHLVWEHTCLSALTPDMRPGYAEGIGKALKTGGHMAGVFYIDPDLDPGETGPPFGISAAEVEALWQQAGFTVIASWVPGSGYPDRLGRERVVIARKS